MASRVFVALARAPTILLPNKFTTLGSQLNSHNNFKTYTASASASFNRQRHKHSASSRKVVESSATLNEVQHFADGRNHTETPENWKIKMLYDGECPLCMREVKMLRERNEAYGSIKFVDISALDYSSDENGGITFEMAMGKIHAVLKDGTLLQNVAAFKRLYEEVDLGWVYAITNYEPFSKIAESLYAIWAKYRLPLTGRPPLAKILEEKRQQKLGANCTNEQCHTK